MAQKSNTQKHVRGQLSLIYIYTYHIIVLGPSMQYNIRDQGNWARWHEHKTIDYGYPWEAHLCMCVMWITIILLLGPQPWTTPGGNHSKCNPCEWLPLEFYSASPGAVYDSPDIDNAPVTVYCHWWWLFFLFPFYFF